jgi:hypothetical protein
VSKIPLAYIIRTKIELSQAATDPAFGENGSKYLSRQEELIARAPINDPGGAGFTATYLADRAKVWELFSELTRDKDCWTYARPAQKTRDGRLAYQSLRGHYLGVNNVDNMSPHAERKLANTTYTGEKRRWNFEKYVKLHVDQHAILESLVTHGYAGIDERSKVRHLMNGIKAPGLGSVKSRILSDPQLRQDFDACVNLYQDYIKQNRTSTTRDSQISAFQTTKDKFRGKGGDKDDSLKPDMSVEDRYYKKNEYNKLSDAKKLGLRKKREARGQKPGEFSKKGSAKDGKVDQRLVKAVISALKAKRGKDHENDMEEAEVSDSDSEDEEVPMAPPAKRQKTGNRANRALTRQ